MPTDNWFKIKEVFSVARQYSGAKQERYLDEVCASDAALRREVEILLHSYESDFLEIPVLSKVTEQIDLNLNKIQIGDEINHYKISAVLGKGGMGEVYLAEDTKLGRKVAIKFLKYTSEKTERQIIREAQTSALLNHPNICTVFEIGETGSGSYMVMEYLEGETLGSLIRNGDLSFNEIICIIGDIADALEEAHANGVIHRDIKPSNVIVTSKGQVKVLDFGLAKRSVLDADNAETSFVSDAGMIAGTVSYMSPEQARGNSIDKRSDIWSLGVVFYEMLTKSQPFRGDTKSDVIAAVLLGEYVSVSSLIPELPPITDQIIDKALKKERSRRFAGVADFISELRILQSQLNYDSPPDISKFYLRTRKNQSFSAESRAFAGKTFETQWETDSERIHVTNESTPVPVQNRLPALIRKYAAGSLALLALVSMSFAGWSFYRTDSVDQTAFSSLSRNRLQISSLFSTKRMLNGEITNVSFSPDGKLLAFLLTSESASDIYIKPVDSGEPVKLSGWQDSEQPTRKRVIKSPVWSPDGQQLAFIGERAGKLGIWVVSYLGGTPVLQTTLPAEFKIIQLKKWSNDGKRIFFEADDNLKTIETESGQISEVLLDNPSVIGSFSISNNEKMISFVAMENGKEKIFVKTLENGEIKLLSDGEFSHWSPVFFPDNQRIAYTSNQNGNFQIYIADLSTSENTQITFGDSNADRPTISPDGKKIVFVSESDEANIFSFDLKTEKETQQTSKTKLHLFPDISPTGEKLVYQVTDYRTKIYASPIKIRNLNAGGEPFQIGDGGGWAKWSPKGDKIAYLKYSGFNVNLWILDVNNRKELPVTFGGVNIEIPSVSPYNQPTIPFSWSPDGTKIVYTSRQSGFNDIWTIDEDGLNPQNLTNNSNENVKYSSPIWNSDNNMLAFNYRLKFFEGKNLYGVATIKDGKIYEFNQSDLPLKVLGWQELSGNLIFAAHNKGKVELFKISAASDHQKESLVTLEDANFDTLELSPDARKIVFSVRRKDIENIFIYTLEGGYFQVTKNLESTMFYSGITWSPDGDELFYSKQSGGLQISMIADTK